MARDAALVALGVGLLLWCVHTGISTALKERLFDFRCFYDAAVAVSRGENIYEAGTRGYIYPPMLAAFIEALGHLSLRSAGVVWSIVITVLIACAALVGAGEVSKRFGLQLRAMQIGGVASFGMLVVGDKLNRELKEGNCNVLILLGVLLALRWVGTRPLLCGLALAFAIHIKYVPVVFVPLMVMRGFWRDALATVGAIVVLAVLPGLRYGWERNIEYLRTAVTGMDHMAGGTASGSGANIHPLAWEQSISIPSAAARIVAAMEVAPVWTWIATGVIGVTVVLAVAWMYRRNGVAMMWRDERGMRGVSGLFAAEWCGLLAMALIFSPQMVARHANMALPMAIVAAVLVLHGAKRARRLAALGAGVVFVGLTFPPGIDALDGVARMWRGIGGISWCVLAMVMMVVAACVRGGAVGAGLSLGRRAE